MTHHFDTLAIHAGQPNEPGTGAVTTPIYQTSTFAQIAPGETKGFCYARTEHPTRQALEECLAALEGGKHGAAFASGLAAVNCCLSLLKAGDHVVSSKDTYGGSYRIFTKVFAKFGVEFTFVDPTDLGAIKAAFKPNTRMLWLETPSNPLLSVTDIAAATQIARQKGDILVVVDNTFATPYLQRPLELGVDIVLHSTTKYLNGHGDVIGGALVTNRDDLAKEFHFMQNTLGGIPGPQDCFLVLRGLKTLSVRMDRHCRNAQQVAEFLAKHPKVARVYYPGLETHPNHHVAQHQMRQYGAMLSAELKCDVDEAKRFATYTRVFTLAESLGSVKSLLCHPPTMTHASVEPEVRRKVGIPDGLIRLSVGLEDARDLIADLSQALEQVRVS
jgi:cystathionine gamma-lyase